MPVLNEAEILSCSPNLPTRKFKRQLEAMERRERASPESYSVEGD